MQAEDQKQAQRSAEEIKMLYTFDSYSSLFASIRGSRLFFLVPATPGWDKTGPGDYRLLSKLIARC